MKTHRIIICAVVFVGTFLGGIGRGEGVPAHRRTEDVVYGRKFGMALTLDVIAPERGANGAAVVYAMSGGWVSAHEMIRPEMFAEMLGRGYTVFCVVHGCQPKFTIPEVLEDMNRSIRFIRRHAKDYHIDPRRIGIAGGSAGGHLSLMIGTAGTPGNPQAKDPINRESSRVQAVACWYPPTDFTNYGQEGRDVFVALEGELDRFKAPFDFVTLDETARQFKLITDIERRRQIAREISPITHVTSDDPPTLIIHGDADKLVPIQQAEAIGKRFEAQHVPFKLVVRPGAGHGWPELLKDMVIFADWFDQHLGARPPKKAGTTTTAAADASAGTAAPAAVLGYVTEIPPEPAEARRERHRLVSERRSGVPIIVHRGAWRIAPENTLEAYAAAMDAGADGIEIDIRRSTDGVLYLFHDDTLERLTNGTGRVKELSYYELLRITPKSVFGPATPETRPPTLAAVLALVRDRAALLHLDIKESGLQADIARLFDEADVWDHIVEINNYNADRLRADPRVKLLPYAGWVPEQAEPAAIKAFMEDARRDHRMVICEDPRSAVAALGRKPPGDRPLPPGLRAQWTPQGLAAASANQPAAAAAR
ncbi:MAG: prolyl oligopeptidase family serine peptidase [Planctomycetes bacterium]|nr:prolyl oligopeptidase family serine peptidase [Planctomycetota bacterium]